MSQAAEGSAPSTLPTLPPTPRIGEVLSAICGLPIEACRFLAERVPVRLDADGELETDARGLWERTLELPNTHSLPLWERVDRTKYPPGVGAMWDTQAIWYRLSEMGLVGSAWIDPAARLYARGCPACFERGSIQTFGRGRAAGELPCYKCGGAGYCVADSPGSPNAAATIASRWAKLHEAEANAVMFASRIFAPAPTGRKKIWRVVLASHADWIRLAQRETDAYGNAVRRYGAVVSRVTESTIELMTPEMGT